MDSNGHDLWDIYTCTVLQFTVSLCQLESEFLREARGQPSHGGFHSHRNTPIYRWFMMENPIYKWMMTGGTPISGNPDLALRPQNVGSYLWTQISLQKNAI